MDLELTGKVAVITGASRGVGKAIARELAKEGVDVAICARHREALEEAAGELEQETGRRILPVPADTTKDNYDFHGLLQKAGLDKSLMLDDRTFATQPDRAFEAPLVFKRSALTHDGTAQYYFGKLLAHAIH